MNGGYIMIDCKGMNLLAESSQTITGLHAKFAEALASGKPILACNCVYGTGVKSSPIPVFMIKESTSYVATTSILQITVGADDSVTITNLTT